MPWKFDTKATGAGRCELPRGAAVEFHCGAQDAAQTPRAQPLASAKLSMCAPIRFRASDVDHSACAMKRQLISAAW